MPSLSKSPCVVYFLLVCLLSHCDLQGRRLLNGLGADRVDFDVNDTEHFHASIVECVTITGREDTGNKITTVRLQTNDTYRAGVNFYKT